MTGNPINQLHSPRNLPEIRKVLIIDDDEDILYSISDLLEYWGKYIVFTASNRVEAESIIRNSSPDIALVDIKLGNEDGLDLIKSLKVLDPELICITMTGFRDAELTPKAVRSGANDFIYKPADPDQLLETLQQHLEQRRLSREMDESERRFRGIFNHTFQLLFLLEPDGKLIEANATALEFAGADKSLVTGKLFWDTPWWRSARPGLTTTNYQRVKQAVAAASLGEFSHYETEMLDKNGAVVTMDFSMKPVSDDSGKISLIIVESRDISRRTEMENRLRENEAQVNSLLKSATEAMCGLGIDGKCTFANSRCVNLLGYNHAGELLGKLLFRPDESSTSDATIAKLFATQPGLITENHAVSTGTGRFYGKDGGIIPVTYRSEPITYRDTVTGVILTFSEIRDDQEEPDTDNVPEIQNDETDHYDLVTKLPDRILLYRYMKQNLKSVKLNKGKMALFMIDIDHIEQGDEDIDQQAVDSLLSEIAGRLQTTTGSDNNLFCLNRNSFALSLELPSLPDSAVTTARDILEQLAIPFVINGNESRITVSIGIATYPEDGLEVETLLRNSDLAMYQAKTDREAKFRFFNKRFQQLRN